MIVSRKRLDEALHELKEGVRDPSSGIHPPGGAAWRVNRESANFLGAGRAVLLQLAHPAVAYGVLHHSATYSDPWGRFRRTFEAVFSMAFGDLDSALEAARTVHSVHGRVTGEMPVKIGAFESGERYYANESEGLLWVFATLIDSAMRVQERALGRVSREQKSDFYSDSKRFARLFGIPKGEIPQDLDAFSCYMARKISSSSLEVSQPAREMAQLLFPRGGVTGLGFHWYRTLTADLLPSKLRRAYGLRYGLAERLLAANTWRAFRRVWPALPRVLRYVPAYAVASARHSGQSPYAFASLAQRVSLIAS